MTNQQELELLAKWMGIDLTGAEWSQTFQALRLPSIECYFDPSPTGNSDDFLNMIAGRVDFGFEDTGVMAYGAKNYDIRSWESYHDHNNDKVAAMKHAAYQVCLMAAREEVK